MKGILVHKYTNASDDMDAYLADQRLRQAVTVEFAYQYLVDVPLYVYRKDVIGEGLWIDIVGMDLLIAGENEGKFVLEYGRTSEMIVPADFRVFVDISKLAKAVAAADPALVMKCIIANMKTTS